MIFYVGFYNTFTMLKRTCHGAESIKPQRNINKIIDFALILKIAEVGGRIIFGAFSGVEKGIFWLLRSVLATKICKIQI